MNGIITCPKCQIRVLPKQDGTCPSCHSKIESGKKRKTSLSTKSENLKKSGNSRSLITSTSKNSSSKMVSPSNEIPKSSRKKVGESKSQSYSPKATVQTVEPLIPIKEAKISNQVQCPNCGGYKIDGSVRRIDPETGRAVRGKSGAGCFWFAGITGLGVILSVMSRDTNGVLAIAGFVLGFIAAWVSDAISKQKVKQAIARAYNLYNYSCNLCGYRWEWRDGQPWPKVKVNPDLIAKGAQKLEEETREAEEERKRQEALYHLSKLGKK